MSIGAGNTMLGQSINVVKRLLAGVWPGAEDQPGPDVCHVHGRPQRHRRRAATSTSFLDHCSRSFQLCTTTPRAVQHALLCACADRVLIGACNPMASPLHLISPPPTITGGPPANSGTRRTGTGVLDLNMILNFSTCCAASRRPTHGVCPDLLRAWFGRMLIRACDPMFVWA